MGTVDLVEVSTPDSLAIAADPLTDVNRFGVTGVNEGTELWTQFLKEPRSPKMQGFWTKERIQEWLNDTLHLFHVPSAYYGDEIGTYLRTDADFAHSPFRVAAIGGSSYTGLAGNLGIPLVYTLCNKQNPSFITERSYFPMSRSDLEKFTKRGVPMFTLETKRDIKEFDLCMFSGSYCGVDINIIKMLEMTGIPIEYAERDESWPIIGRGGCHSFSPEPFYGMYDWMYIGDAEPHLSTVLRALAQGQADKKAKWDTLYDMVVGTDHRTEAEVKKGKRGIPGLYVPAFHEESYYAQDEEGRKHPVIKERKVCVSFIKSNVTPSVIQAAATDSDGKCPGTLEEQALAVPLSVDRVYIKSLNDDFLFTDQVVSFHDPGMSAGTLLISRGCNAKCSFCQEGMTWMPYREVSADKAANGLGEMMQNTGALNVLPSAFCASSYTQKKQLMKNTLEKHSDQIKLISQRVDEMAEDPNFVALTGFMGNDTPLAHETRILTREGIKKIGDLEGETFEVLTREGWNQAILRKWENEPLNRISLRSATIQRCGYTRSPTTKYRPEIYATPAHKWPLVDGSYTNDLQVGDLVKPLAAKVDNEHPDYADGVRHGFIFGDGSHTRENSDGTHYHRVDFFGPSAAGAVPFFSGVHKVKSHETRVESYIGTTYLLADKNLKLLPTEESPEYLAGFIQGWADADGYKDDWGAVRIQACDKAHIEWLTEHAPYGGLAVVGKSSRKAQSKGAYGTRPIHEVVMRAVLDANFAYHVDSIEDSGREEDAFCVAVIDGGPPEFTLAGGLGTGNCSLGVEGNSQRIRDMLNKNCTEDELLTATSHLLRAKYKKIKFFMIANIPGETYEDVMEVVQLAAKAAKLRDELGSKCDIKFSWTPLVIQSFTPMQYCRPTLEKRSLSDVFKKLKEVGVTFRLGSGAKYDEAYLMQLLHLADRRIWPMIKHLVVNDGLVHYGSTPKGTKAKLEEMLHDEFPNFEPNSFVNADGEIETENIWDVFFHEKTMNELLPWDFINVAVSKDYLWKRYLDFQNAVQTTKCDQLCDTCGVCDKFDHNLRHKLHENEDPEVDLPSVKVIKQRGNVMRIRFKVKTPQSHRFAENEYWKFYFRRALYKIGAPVDKRSVQFASDDIPFKNHLSGVDYIDAKFFETVDVGTVLDALTEPRANESKGLLGQWEILGAKAYTGGMVGVRAVPALNHYVMPFSEDAERVTNRLERTLASQECLVTLRSEGFMGIEAEEIDARPWIHDLWATRVGTQLMVHMVLRNRLSPYDMYAAIFPQAMSAIYKIPAERVDSYLELNRDQDDFFRPVCQETGEPIEVSMFDKPVSDHFCLKALDTVEGRLVSH